MTDLTRRGFVKNSAGAAASMSAIAAILAQQAQAHGGGGAHPVVAYVSDPSSGNVEVMTATREVTVHDPSLAARIVRAAR